MLGAVKRRRVKPGGSLAAVCMLTYCMRRRRPGRLSRRSQAQTVQRGQGRRVGVGVYKQYTWMHRDEENASALARAPLTKLAVLRCSDCASTDCTTVPLFEWMYVWMDMSMYLYIYLSIYVFMYVCSSMYVYWFMFLCRPVSMYISYVSVI